MSAALTRSKAFRACLALRDHEVGALQQWAARSCALHAVFRSERGSTVLVGLRASPQTSASFARTLRSALRKCAVPTSGLRGRWVFLLSEREAISLCLDNSDVLLGNPQLALRAAAGDTTPRAAARADDGDDTRLVTLR